MRLGEGLAFSIWTLRSGDNNSARQAFLYISLMSLHDIDYDVNVAKFSFSFGTRIWFFRNSNQGELAYVNF